MFKNTTQSHLPIGNDLVYKNPDYIENALTYVEYTGGLKHTSVMYSESFDPCFVECQYRWIHLPTGQCVIKTIWVESISGFEALLAHWNKNRPDMWPYTYTKI